MKWSVRFVSLTRLREKVSPPLVLLCCSVLQPNVGHFPLKVQWFLWHRRSVQVDGLCVCFWPHCACLCLNNAALGRFKGTVLLLFPHISSTRATCHLLCMFVVPFASFWRDLIAHCLLFIKIESEWLMTYFSKSWLAFSHFLWQVKLCY